MKIEALYNKENLTVNFIVASPGVVSTSTFKTLLKSKSLLAILSGNYHEVAARFNTVSEASLISDKVEADGYS